MEYLACAAPLCRVGLSAAAETLVCGCSIVCYGRMSAFVVFVFVFLYYAKRLAGKNASKMTYFVPSGT